MKDFYLATFRTVREYMLPYLTDFERFSESLTNPVEGVERGSNIQYAFDLEADAIVKAHIEEAGLEGRVFSEESGFYTVGTKNKYRIVFDPFCNSTLASRGMLDSACGITVFSWDYEVQASGILDYQTGVVAYCELGKSTELFSIATGVPIPSQGSSTTKLEDAWVALKLENQEERANLQGVDGVFRGAKRLLVGSGHIYWLRLALGTIDAYIVPTRGQKLYEMFAASVAQGAGCIVSDVSGEIFDPGKYLKIFEENPAYRYYPVAARNQVLHAELMAKGTV